LTSVRFVLRAAAQRDLDAHIDYLGTVADNDTALRFVDSARASFDALDNAPHLGPAVPTSNSDLGGLRKWRIAGFPNYLIFYQPEKGRVRVLRVLHAAQDWWAALDIASGDT
jgi:toxin ParE1/3/4